MRYVFSFFILFALAFNIIEANIERRAAIDIGSGSTKVAIADVDTESKKIVHLLYENSYPVPYQLSLDKSEDGSFDQNTKSLGIKTFKEIKDLASQFEVQKIKAVATSAFRKATDSKEFIQEIKKETAIDVAVIPQKEEGEIAFFSALATGEFSSDDAIVWDIGTGSLQITTLNKNGSLTVYMGEQMGSVAFKSYIIEAIQADDVGDKVSPNPMTEDDYSAADRFARAFGRKAYPIIKEKIKATDGKVLGIGRLFFHSIRPIAAEDGVITRKGLRKFINDSLNKTDEELNNPFASVDVSNSILALAIMKALHIHEIVPVDTTSTRGILIYSSYWYN